MPGPPNVTVSYDPQSNLITCDPDRVEVQRGNWTLNWLKDKATAPWNFVDLGFKASPPPGCFTNKKVNPNNIHLTDNNATDECVGVFPYFLTIRDTNTGQEHSQDPEIENKPRGF